MSNKPIDPTGNNQENIVLTQEVSIEIPVDQLNQWASDSFPDVDLTTPLMSGVSEDLGSQLDALDADAARFLQRLGHVSALMVAESELIHKPLQITGNPGTRYGKLVAFYENAAILRDIVRQVNGELGDLPSQISLSHASKWVESLALVYGLELPERMNAGCAGCGGKHGHTVVNLGSFMGGMFPGFMMRPGPDEDEE